MKQVVASLIRVIHVVVVLFIGLTPFHYNAAWPTLLMHVTSSLSLLVHWYFNDDSCFLTLLETKMRGVDVTESFIHQLVSPFYKVHDKVVRTFVFKATLLLAAISSIRLVKQTTIQTIKDHLRLGHNSEIGRVFHVLTPTR